MRKLTAIAALVAMAPLASTQAQTFNLFPTDGGGNWQVKCTVLAVDAPPMGPCNGAYTNAVRVTATPGGWADVPVAGPAGNAYYINKDATASLWPDSPNENPHYEYTFKTTFNVDFFDPTYASLSLNVFRLDNYFGGWSLNGSAFNTSGITPGPLGANGGNWETPFQMTIPGDGFVNGLNTLEIRIQGNGRTDAILAQGTYTTVPEPGTVFLVSAGLAMCAVVARRRRAA